MAAELKKAPPDLTKLAARRGGMFPIEDFAGIYGISGETTRGSHGTREMPVWGPIFSQVTRDQDLGHVRVDNLARYLRGNLGIIHETIHGPRPNDRQHDRQTVLQPRIGPAEQMGRHDPGGEHDGCERGARGQLAHQPTLVPLVEPDVHQGRPERRFAVRFRHHTLTTET